jgi:hypothetical protein
VMSLRTYGNDVTWFMLWWIGFLINRSFPTLYGLGLGLSLMMMGSIGSVISSLAEGEPGFRKMLSIEWFSSVVWLVRDDST